MSIHAALHHVTHYQYDRPIGLGPQIVRLRPAPHCRSHVVSYSLKVEPAQHFINWQQDPFANYQARLVFPEKTTQFKVTVDLVVEMSVYNPFDFFLEPHAEQFPFGYSESQQQELAPYLATEPATPRVQAYLDRIDRKPQRTIDFLVGLNQQVAQDIRYLIRMEPGVQTPEQTLESASGSCRDSGWLLVQLLRHMGLAARFVSGYLIQLTPDVKSLDGPSGTDHDFTDLHAWCEVYLPGAGWIGLDATSGLMAGEGHIPLACTPQPSTAAPIEGLVDEAEVEFHHEMRVTRIHESPRVTKPYTEAQWQDVLALGEAVDAELVAGDVRLTMGGEPTFVAQSDRDAAEWNTDALGPTKRGYATELVHKLRAEYGEGGFLHFGQGKWYPGEQLPRWALSICWRTDGQPAWNNPALFADEREPQHYTREDARRFIHHLARTLDLTDTHIQPGFEDTWYYLWRERRLPVNVDPFDARLDDELERARLRRVFEQKLDSVVGYVLPLEPVRGAGPALGGATWATGPWFFRDERMYLIPGDSPMGYRLPLDSLPWVSQGDYPYLIPQDPSVPAQPLPGAAALRARYATLPSVVTGGRDLPYLAGASAAGEARRVGQGLQQDTGDARAAGQPAPAGFAPPGRFASAAGLTRTALCVEARDPRRANGPKAEQQGDKTGVLYVFMPPLAHLDDYLDLLAAVESTAEALGVQIVLEGLSAAARCAPEAAAGDARPWRDRGEHPPRAQLGRTGAAHRVPLPGGLGVAPVGREVHDRRPPHRHGRRQPFRDGRRHAGRLAFPAQAGAAGQPDPVLAQPPVVELPVQRHVRGTDQPGTARGRGAQRPAVRAGDRPARDREEPRALRPGHAAVAGGPHAAQHPHRRDGQHAPQRVLHRQDVLAR
ncbi:transglutaminase-like putative cysteine protease [Paracidovorax wautersii]|uniref:Transglutaminase-like putative cysteine protease n=1 Tax=Paracidovorax wautersii TaxID=1177982 RepID=A0ABU1I631_9BURK|nr:transglutaminase-like putative cysteine protease [Paracidovorax wautersii]